MSIAVARHADQALQGLDRLLIRGSWEEDWYIASSLNNNLCAEGSWEKWVALAQEIIEEDKKRKLPGYRVQQIIF